MKLQNWYILIILLFVSALQAQTKEHDSLLQISKSQEGLEKLKTLEQLYTSIRFKDRNKAKDYVIEALQLSKSLNDDLGIATANYRMGSLMKSINLDSSLYYYDKAQKFAVTASFGVCTFSSDSTEEISESELIRRADEALYDAKKKGRNCVAMYKPNKGWFN